MSIKRKDSSPLSKSRERLVELMNIIKDCHDKDRKISTDEIINELDSKGIRTDRRALYGDFKVINSITGYEIRKGHRKYEIHKRSDISKQELEIIINALASARFLTKDDTKELIDKLYDLTDFKRETGLSNKITVGDSIKSKNGSIRENIEKIDEAMRNNKQIKFKYMKYDAHKDSKIKEYDYKVSPYAHSWYEDFYYMIGNYKECKMSYYRVDRMKRIKILDEPRKKLNEIDNCGNGLNVSDMLSKLVGMASGKEETIRVRVDKDYMGKIIDKLGEQVKEINSNDKYADVNIKVINNKELIPWILKFGDSIEVIDPYYLRESIRYTIDKMNKIYEE